MKKFNNVIGFDLGTSKIRIYKDGKLASEFDSQLKINNEIQPPLIVEGKIANIIGLKTLLQQEVKKIKKPFLGFLNLPFTALSAIPSYCEGVTQRSFMELMQMIGANEIFLTHNCFITHFAFDNLDNSDLVMMVDSGAGKTSITTLQKTEIMDSKFLDIAGISFDQAIQAYINLEYKVIIDLKTAEDLKIKYADFRNNKPPSKTILFEGKDKSKGNIVNLKIASSEISSCLENKVNWLIDQITRHFEELKDIDKKSVEKRGIYLTGNNFKTKGLIEMLSKKVKINPKSYDFNEPKNGMIQNLKKISK